MIASSRSWKFGRVQSSTIKLGVPAKIALMSKLEPGDLSSVENPVAM